MWCSLPHVVRQQICDCCMRLVFVFMRPGHDIKLLILGQAGPYQKRSCKTVKGGLGICCPPTHPAICTWKDDWAFVVLPPTRLH